MFIFIDVLTILSPYFSFLNPKPSSWKILFLFEAHHLGILSAVIYGQWILPVCQKNDFIYLHFWKIISLSTQNEIACYFLSALQRSSTALWILLLKVSCTFFVSILSFLSLLLRSFLWLLCSALPHISCTSVQTQWYVWVWVSFNY